MQKHEIFFTQLLKADKPVTINWRNMQSPAIEL